MSWIVGQGTCEASSAHLSGVALRLPLQLAPLDAPCQQCFPYNLLHQTPATQPPLEQARSMQSPPPPHLPFPHAFPFLFSLPQSCNYYSQAKIGTTGIRDPFPPPDPHLRGIWPSHASTVISEDWREEVDPQPPLSRPHCPHIIGRPR